MRTREPTREQKLIADMEQMQRDLKAMEADRDRWRAFCHAESGQYMQAQRTLDSLGPILAEHRREAEDGGLFDAARRAALETAAQVADRYCSPSQYEGMAVASANAACHGASKVATAIRELISLVPMRKTPG